MNAPDREAAVTVAERLAHALTSRLASERLTLAALEEESRRLHDELALMERSAGRRLFLRVRESAMRVVRTVRHPLWTTGSGVRRIAAIPALATARHALHYVRRRSLLLRMVSPVSPLTPADAASSADPTRDVRWIGPITVRHDTREALFCHPTASVDYQMTVPSGSRFITGCALSPFVWQHRPAPVDFAVTIHVPATGWRATRRCQVAPSARYTDRRWVPVAIDLPSSTDAAVDVLVTLETRQAPGTPGEYAWAVFGEPRFEWSRSPAEIRRSAAIVVGHVRSQGLRPTLALLRRHQSAEEQAAIYAKWVAAHTMSPDDLSAVAADVARLPLQPLISIVTPVYNTDPRWLRACVESVRRQVYPHWELCLCDDASPSAATGETLREFEGDERIRIVRLETNLGISGASNAALALATGEYVALLDHDDELTPDALAEVVRWINAHPDTDVLYSDEDKLDLAGTRCDPAFKPDWSPEHFLHRMYTCHLKVVRRSLMNEVGGFRRGYEGAQDYDLMLRLMERTEHIGHVPRILYHWRKLPESTASAGQAKPWAMDAGRLALEDYARRRGIEAEVLPSGGAGLFRMKRRIAGRPLVSIVIPTAGRTREVGGTAVDLLAQAVSSVKAHTAWPDYEFVIVGDAAGLQASTLRALEGTRHQILVHRAQGPFNFSRKINEGVAASAGEHLLLFNDDLEAIDGDWMSAMIEYSQDPSIGAVGAKLMYPDGRLQHIGIIMGVNGIAAHAFHQHAGSSAGYMGSAIGPRNLSAVTAACLMTRRDVFDRAGGFDEAFPIDFNDVDFCLRVRRAGFRIVFTPYARLLHHESASFGARTQDRAGIDEMRRRWPDVLDRDPYYNPNLGRDFPDYRL